MTFHWKSFRKKILVAGVLSAIISVPSTAANVTAISTGLWSNPVIWAPSSPSIGDDVTIPTGVTVFYDLNITLPAGSITIDGVL